VTMSRALFVATVVCGLIQTVHSSQAWSEFEASADTLAKANSARRLLATGLDQGTSAGAVQVQPLSPEVPSGEQTWVTVNSFILGTNGNTDDAQVAIKKNIFDLCKKGSAGTSFSTYMGITSDDSEADPQCYYCLAKGYGTDESTPGFYLPCGCQKVCVDVSGNSKGSFSTADYEETSPRFYGDLTDDTNGQHFPPLSNSLGRDGAYAEGQPMGTCQDYIDNQMVTTCGDIFRYHFVLWPSVFASLALFYTAYSMINMQLDMDSLLYTVGSSKKDN